MNQENHPKEVRSNNRGANQDIDKEILGANSKGGQYIEGRNLRVSSIKSEREAAEKIQGEELVHSNTLPGNYVNICSTSVNGKKFEVWVDENGVEDPTFIIDGAIVAQSDKIPFLAEFPIQHDKNESCIGGEVFLTDDNSPPMIFNIQDLIDSLITSPTKYFADFDPNQYSINLEQPLNVPVFSELVNLGGSNGLPIGSYIYSIRYVTDDGDRTDWSPATPPIPVLENVSSNSNIFPGVRTFGGPANTSNNTNYGVKIKFRVNNSANFDFIEIRRESYNQGVSNVVTPEGRIIAKIGIVEDEISVREFVDPVDSNVDDPITEEEEVNNLSIIDRAKGIRYHDKRLVLMNVAFQSRNVDSVTFKDINGVNGVPIVENLGKLGYKDPYNHVYNKEFMGGEKYGFSATFFGGTGGQSFSKAIPGFENYEFPNRRDPLSADSLTYSYSGAPIAANASGGVSEVFEAFDHENAVVRTDKCSFKNIVNHFTGRTQFTVNQFQGCPDAGYGPYVQGSELGHLPFRPTSDQDPDISGHEYRECPFVSRTPSSSNARSYNPQAFGVDYYSKGVAFGGVENLPSWVKGFSVSRTDPAGRIVMQGLGSYSINEGGVQVFVGNEVVSDPSKERNKFWFYSGDEKFLDPSFIEDIIENPTDYAVQLVSPLGFFSEVYHYYNESTPNSKLVDMITYARILHDEGQINPNEDPNMGVGSGGKRYVAHNKYRNTGAASGGAFGGNGNKLFPLKSISEKTDTRTNFFEIELNEDVYNASPIPNSLLDFDSPAAKEWHEPFYIINIVNIGAEVPNLNVDSYKGTGHFQKIESIIGVGDGSANQEFELVDERWEDCIPDLSSGGAFAGFNSYVYLKDNLGISETWMNVTFKSAAQRATIINDILTLGFHTPEPGVQVVGLYTHTNSNNRDFTILFDIPGYYPTDDKLIIVRYDDRRPIRVFGGDCVVAENIYSPVDKNTRSTDLDDGEGFILNAPFPYRHYFTNARHFVPRGPQVEPHEATRLIKMRQMAMMFAAETRAAINFAHNADKTPTGEYFPLTHYRMRSSNSALALVDYFPEYLDDYEPTLLDYGGIRPVQTVNIDYSYDGPLRYFSRPDFGFEEENEFCTAVIWSLPRAVNQQDSPGLKTFLTLNRRDIADDQGEIKKAWDATTGGKGENLYAITNKGVCLLLTKKSILSNIDADDLTTAAADEFVSGEYWISKTIGSTDEMWRGMGEGTIGFVTETGNVEKEVLYFPNKESVFMLSENLIKDIGRNDYYSRLRPFLRGLRPGYEGHLAGVINKNNNEYWLDIELGDNEDRKLFVYGNENNLWEGYFDYAFDSYYMSDDTMFAARNLQTYELNKGFTINGQNIVFELLTPFAPGNVALEKEFIRIGVQTGLRGTMKPTKIEFYDQDMTLLCSLDQLNQGGLFLKQYDGWEQFIGRKDTSVSATRDRVQGRVVLVKIIHDNPEDFKLVTTTMQYKIIK